MRNLIWQHVLHVHCKIACKGLYIMAAFCLLTDRVFLRQWSREIITFRPNQMQARGAHLSRHSKIMHRGAENWLQLTFKLTFCLVADEVRLKRSKWRKRTASLVPARSGSPSFARPRLAAPISLGTAMELAIIRAIIRCQTFCECGGYDWIVPKLRRPPASPIALVIASSVTGAIVTAPIPIASCPPHQICVETTLHIPIKVPKVREVTWLLWPLWVQPPCLPIKDQVRKTWNSYW